MNHLLVSLIGLLITLFTSPVLSGHIVIDTDIGDDFDDMMALTFIASIPSDVVSLDAVIVSSFNTTKRAMMVAYAFDCFYKGTMNPKQYPIIVMGIPGPDTSPMYQFSFVPSTFTMDDYQKRGGRVMQLKDFLPIIQNWNVDQDEPLRYIEIAPVSSLGYIIQALDVKYLSNMRVFTMNGAVYSGYNGKAPAVIEYNVAKNIGASTLMYANADKFYTADDGAGVISAPLDTTVFQQYNGDNWQDFLESNTTDSPFAYTLLNAYEHWYAAGGKNNGALLPFSPKTGTSTMYDVQAAYSSVNYLVDHTLCNMDSPYLTYTCLNIRVNSTGYTIVDNDHGKPVAVATGFPSTNPYDSVNEIGSHVLVVIANGGQSQKSTLTVDE